MQTPVWRKGIGKPNTCAWLAVPIGRAAVPLFYEFLGN